MQSIQQKIEKQNEIPVTYFVYDFNKSDKLYYFEKLRIFIIIRGQTIQIYGFETRECNKSYISENSFTKKIQQQIQQQIDQLYLPSIFISEETEQIVVYGAFENQIHVFQQSQNEFQQLMRDYQGIKLEEFQLFQKYFIGKRHNELIMLRKNQLKLLIRKKFNFFFNIKQCYHMIIIKKSEGKYRFYKRLSFKLKMVRKYKNKIKSLSVDGKYFFMKDAAQGVLKIIDLTSMIEIEYKTEHYFYESFAIKQLGLFFITKSNDPGQQENSSFDLDKNTLFQVFKSNQFIKFIEYSQSYGLLILCSGH